MCVFLSVLLCLILIVLCLILFFCLFGLVVSFPLELLILYCMAGECVSEAVLQLLYV